MSAFQDELTNERISKTESDKEVKRKELRMARWRRQSGGYKKQERAREPEQFGPLLNKILSISNRQSLQVNGGKGFEFLVESH